MATKQDHPANVRSLLVGQGLNIPDSRIYAGPLHEEMEDDCITMVETGGPSADDAFGTREAIQHPRLQIMVRHDDKVQGKSDADDVWQLLHDNEPSGYSRTTMLQSGPIHADVDDESRHYWTVNIEMFISE